MVLGVAIYLICNNTQASMEDITKDPKWLNAQVPFAESLMSVSLRTDEKYENLPSWVFPQKGQKYFDSYDYKFVTNDRDAAMAKARELLGE